MDQRQQFQDSGYLLLRGFVADAAVAQLRGIVERIFQQWLAANRSISIEQRLVNMHSLTSPAYFSKRFAERIALFNLIAGETLTAQIDAVFGPDIYFHNTQLFFNPLAPRLPYWHRDLQYSGRGEAEQQRLLTTRLDLHVRLPLLPERGFELIPGSHRRWDDAHERAVRLELDGLRNSDDLPNSRRFDLQPGDVLIFHAHMLHRGNYALNTERRGFDICLGASKPAPIAGPEPALLPEREELPFIRFPQWYSRARSLAR